MKKRQRRLPGFDDKVIALYARGMTTREIQGGLQEIYGVEVSPSLISNVTDSVLGRAGLSTRFIRSFTSTRST